MSSQVPKHTAMQMRELEVNNYCARLYYSSGGFQSWEFYFAVVCDLDLHAAVSARIIVVLCIKHYLNIFHIEGYFHCRLFMPGTLSLVPQCVTSRRWCLKVIGSHWISPWKDLFYGMDGLSLHIHILE